MSDSVFKASIKSPTQGEADYFVKKLTFWPTFWSNFGLERHPDLSGSRVLDFGCGHGAFVAAAALEGAHAVGIDLNQRSVRVGSHMVAQRYPQIAFNTRFEVADVANYEGVSFNYIITLETFEHVQNLAEVLNNLYRILIPGGFLFAAWGPLWHSPSGGHSLGFRWSGLPIPFSHLIFTKRALSRYGKIHPDRPHRTIQDVGLNGLSLKEYTSIIEASPFELHRWKTNVGAHPGYRFFRGLSWIPGLKTFLTTNVYATLQKPD